ncbi:hypothetical protein JW905_00550, partial [bacterium]|nr:hypothetical protein [candidate division CSSED10-310 bacterium]
GVRILLQIDDFIVAAETDRVLATVFHPELTPFLGFHAYFAAKCGLTVATLLSDEAWDRRSWMRGREKGMTSR